MSAGRVGSIATRTSSQTTYRRSDCHQTWRSVPPRPEDHSCLPSVSRPTRRPPNTIPCSVRSINDCRLHYQFADWKFLIVEDSLQQLHEIHEAIQAMRDPNSINSAAYAANPLLRLQQCTRLSASCPSLNEPAGQDPPFLDSHGSVGSSPLHLPSSRKGSGNNSFLIFSRQSTVFN